MLDMIFDIFLVNNHSYIYVFEDGYTKTSEKSFT
jgi:hypothetical protein